MKKEISQPLVIAIIILVVIAVGAFGWYEMRIPQAKMSKEEAKGAADRQINMMQDAAKQMGARQSGQGGK